MSKGRIGRAERLIMGGGRSGPYAYLYMPTHPQVQAHGYVPEHRWIAEKALGHLLPTKAQVHHIDENPLNNTNTNLVICEDNHYHKLLHLRTRALDACGNASARVCEICGLHTNQEDISISGRRAYHRKCNAEKASEKRALKLVLQSIINGG